MTNRFRWEHLVPRHIAAHQEAWERRHRYRQAFLNGATYAEIARFEGISRGNVVIKVGRAAREILRKQLSPVEHYARNPGGDFLKLTER